MIRWPDDLGALSRAFHRARPFRHVVIDGLLAAPDLARLAADAREEPLFLVEDEIYLHLRSADPPQQPALRALQGELSASCAQVSRICGVPVSRADGAAYAYLEGHYLLPHADFRESEGRALAYAWYLAAPERGGELELFSCTTRKGQIVATRAARRIPARANRLVLFEVKATALHRIREVQRGDRRSMAGWFYP
jgi:Rps23 Pro-64 3,4-dihydroxylase Tpa1-like proline 4-hydroxylase